MRRRTAASLMPLLILVAPASGLDVSIGGSASSISPTEDAYSESFLTPGTSLGIAASIDAPGPLGFTVGVERFSKSATADWDGDLSATLVTLAPTAGFSPVEGFEVYGGPGAVWASGDYSGTDRYGRFVEADGSSVGFLVAAGGQVDIWGPLSLRLEYRRAFLDLRTDSAVMNGSVVPVYPAAETDLGYSWFGVSALVQLFGEGSPLLGGL